MSFFKWPKWFTSIDSEKDQIALDIVAMIVILNDKTKWCQGTMQTNPYFNNFTCSYCLYGAWYSLKTKNEKTLDVIKQFVIQLEPINRHVYEYVDPVNAITRWNDRPERTFEEVQSLLIGIADFLGVLDKVNKKV